MTTLSLNKAPVEMATRPAPLYWGLLFVALTLAIWSLTDANFAQVIISTIADAYLQVTTFVAATLLIFYGLERLFGFNAVKYLSRSGAWQVPLAAALGA